MGSRTPIRFAIVALLVFSSLSHIPEARGATGDAESGKVELTYDSGKKVVCLTPRWADGGARIQLKSSSGKVTIAGKSTQVSGWVGKRGYKIGFDSNADEIVSDSELRQVAPGGSVVLTGKIDGKERSIRCSDVQISYDQNKGEVRGVRWRMQGVYGWTGTIGTEKIRILDENLDGKYGNDGKDAIQIGTSKLALPLRRQHRIGNDFYKLKIAKDGSSIEFTRIKDAPVGLVRTPFSSKYLVGLVLDGAQGSYDIQACIRTGIPAGNYTVAYGVVGGMRSPVAMYRGRRSVLKYEIQADKKNLLRIGPPLQLVFSSQYKQDERNPSKARTNDKKKKPVKTGKKQIVHRIGVRRPDRVIGAAGEEYGPVTFPNARSARGRPGVIVYQGGRILTKAVMEQKDGNIHDFWYELPRKFSPGSIRVVMVATVGGLGKVTGSRTLKQIYDKEEFAPPKTDKPSVTVTSWKKPIRPTRVAVKPKPPTGPKPKPTPRTKPATTVKPPSKPPKAESTDEQKAQRMLRLARSYQKVNLPDKAIDVLGKLIKKYPKTTTAIVAQELLDTLK